MSPEIEDWRAARKSIPGEEAVAYRRRAKMSPPKRLTAVTSVQNRSDQAIAVAVLMPIHPKK